VCVCVCGVFVCVHITSIVINCVCAYGLGGSNACVITFVCMYVCMHFVMLVFLQAFLMCDCVCVCVLVWVWVWVWMCVCVCV
jgi:hypothetical protein